MLMVPAAVTPGIWFYSILFHLIQFDSVLFYILHFISPWKSCVSWLFQPGWVVLLERGIQIFPGIIWSPCGNSSFPQTSNQFILNLIFPLSNHPGLIPDGSMQNTPGSLEIPMGLGLGLLFPNGNCWFTGINSSDPGEEKIPDLGSNPTKNSSSAPSRASSCCISSFSRGCQGKGHFWEYF